MLVKVTLLLVVLGVAASFLSSVRVNSNLQSQNSTGCNQSLWNHVYNPQRLSIVNSCITVTGVINLIRKENDGDYHIRLALDPKYANLTNAANLQSQNGALVLEPICQNSITQLDAVDACTNFTYNVQIPVNGSHVQVVGSYVLDTAHGWMEVHPVTSIKVIQ